jgi:hypothetical protein
MPTKDLVEVVKNILEALAILAAGVWALFHFFILESPSAQIELEDFKRICADKGALDIEILQQASADKGVLRGVIKLKNVGKREVPLDLTKYKPIQFSPVRFNDDGRYSLTSGPDANFTLAIPGFPPDILTEFFILPGRTLRLPFIEKLPSDTWYMVSFNGGMRNIQTDNPKCVEFEPKGGPTIWHAESIVKVP